MGVGERWSRDEQTLRFAPDGGRGRYGVRPDGTVQAVAVVATATGAVVGVLWADSNGAAGFRPLPGPAGPAAAVWCGQVLATLHAEGVPAAEVVTLADRFAPVVSLGRPAAFESIAEAVDATGR